jgi:hypothetical protein
MINIKSSPDLTEDRIVKNIDECIKKVENILESIIESTPNNTEFDITVTGEDMGDDTLGWADWHGGYIGLNTKYADTDMVFYLNDIEIDLLSLVLLHEIIHVLGGINTSNELNFRTKKFNSTNGEERLLWTGEYCKSNYKDICLKSGLSQTYVDKLQGIPVENDGGEGTEFYHWEEDDYIIINDDNDEIFYPVLMNEIMSGWVNFHNYLTPITIGYLKDINFIIKEQSEWIKDHGMNMLWASPRANLLLPPTTTKDKERFLKYSCCNHNH